MDWVALGIKIASALAGAVLALIFKPPRSRGEAWRRLTFTVIAGVAAGGPLRAEVLRWQDTVENLAFATVLAAAVSWFVAPIFLAALKGIAAPKPK